MSDTATENREKTMRLTGQLMAAVEVLKMARSHLMPSDRRTRDLIDGAQVLADKAVLSAWEHAQSIE